MIIFKNFINKIIFLILMKTKLKLKSALISNTVYYLPYTVKTDKGFFIFNYKKFFFKLMVKSK